MKKNLFIILMILPLAFAACKKDDAMGISIQPEQDKIKVVVDTFLIASEDYHIEAISAQCLDTLSMLLGEYYNEKYGTTKAELIVQIAPPIFSPIFNGDTIFPPDRYNPQPDSLVMLMLYSKHSFGSKIEPFEISVYELDNSAPDYSTQYLTDFDIEQFSSSARESFLLGRKVATSIDQTLGDSITTASGYVPYIRYKFDDVFRDRFFNIAKQQFENEQQFLNQFKGMYITTSYGKSIMLYLWGIDVRLFYHYTYKKNGVDTTVTNYVNFPANKEVRQLNKITHENIQSVINKRDSVNYIKTGGGIYPKLSLPIAKINKQMRDSIGVVMNDSAGHKIITVNSAVLSVEATEIDSAKTNRMPVPTHVLLMPANEVEKFVKEGKLYFVGDSASVYAAYNSTTREYTFDVAKLLNSVLRDKKNADLQTFDMMLVPVDVVTSSNGAVSYHPQKFIGAATIRSSRSQYSPMRLELVYSGF
ncbi:MAG: DUF4270 domain-containing protein [Prevotellaceae bacterium]|nr:DUF4270 domain-containing protein [Prevotellaceae bacterium]